MTDLAAIAARHGDRRHACIYQGGYYFVGDKKPDSECDTRLALDALAAAEARIADPFSVWQGVCGHLWRKVDDGDDCPRCAAEADADALYERLDGLHEMYWPTGHDGLLVGECQACDALAAHDARRQAYIEKMGGEGRCRAGRTELPKRKRRAPSRP